MVLFKFHNISVDHTAAKGRNGWEAVEVVFKNFQNQLNSFMQRKNAFSYNLKFFKSLL